ncbi:endonuclease domain-containing 1 protein-like [Acanthopagrus latus]|uniref:endonuclease domain-containing 1 protein-like n=1 Tax=Acanthopagrus latus TaxID=8177 RepID=UPI00187C5AC0|nr:endonuclease domain-containing 1 protein-like [Acanthopagrus latus]
MLQFSTGPLLLLLPWFGGLVIGEVSNDFSHCLDFFYEKTPPLGFTKAEYQPICQRYKHTNHFATLYHRRRRTPLYSAYKLSFQKGQNRPGANWEYEPQLASPKAGPDMQPFPREIPKRVKNSQAIPEDYKNSSYTRGHLNPSMHHKIKADREATFTLTNIVPQQQGSNQHTWNHLEKEVLNRFKAHCNRLMYVITGVMPYKYEAHQIKKRVSVPEYMWSAYCCPSYKRSLPESARSFFPTYAAVGRNDRDSGEEIVPVNPDANDRIRGYDVRQMPLQELERILRRKLRMPRLSLFKGQCQ